MPVNPIKAMASIPATIKAMGTPRIERGTSDSASCVRTVTWLLQHYVLLPLGLVYIQTIAFILVIAVLVQMLEIIMKKISRPSRMQLTTISGMKIPNVAYKEGR